MRQSKTLWKKLLGVALLGAFAVMPMTSVTNAQADAVVVLGHHHRWHHHHHHHHHHGGIGIVIH